MGITIATVDVSLLENIYIYNGDYSIIKMFQGKNKKIIFEIISGVLSLSCFILATKIEEFINDSVKYCLFNDSQNHTFIVSNNAINNIVIIGVAFATVKILLGHNTKKKFKEGII